MEAMGRATGGKEAVFPENSRKKTSCLVRKVSMAYRGGWDSAVPFPCIEAASAVLSFFFNFFYY